MKTQTYAVAINRMALDEKLPKGDKRWLSFNQSFENQTLDLVDFASEIYTGHAYTSQHDPAMRTSENWKQSQFIAVDMDTEDDRSTLKSLAYNDLVMAYGSLIHTTPSHTPEAPRARVIFLLDRPMTNPTAYANANKFVTALMGGDKAATDPSRFFYGSRNAEIELLHNVLPVDYLYTLYRRHRSKLCQPQAQHRQPAYADGPGYDTHSPQEASYRRNNDTKYNTERDRKQAIRDALDKINPWNLEYLEWVSVIGAIKHEFGDEGFTLASAWADAKKGELEKMWRSMRRQAGNLATAGKIFYLAQHAR